MPTEGVFVNSNRLPSDAIVEFFTALCKVRRKILRKGGRPFAQGKSLSMRICFEAVPNWPVL
jgi:hypothetical protein